MNRFIYFIFSVLAISILNVSAFAEIKVMDCGSDYNAGVNHFSGRFNGSTTSNESVFAALKTDGTLVVWGPLNKGGQDPVTGETSAPISGYKFKQVYANGRAFTALTKDGHLKSWGDTNFGGNAGINYAGAPTDSGYVTVVSSSKAFAAIKNDGSVVSWGNPVYGGEGAPSDKGYVSLFSSGSGFAALKADGSIHSWGGQKNAPGGTGFVSIFANANAFAAIKADGRIVSWGSSQYGGGKAPAKNGFISVASSDDGFAALNKDGSISTFGSEFHRADDWPDKYIDPPTGNNFKAIYANERAFAAITDDGSIVAWGHEKLGGSGAPTDKGYKYIVATAQSFVAVKEDGSVSGWGGIYGESDGTPASFMKFESVVSGYYGYAGLQTDGRIITWGGTDDSHPETYGRPPNGTGFVAVISNDRAFAAIKEDGSVVSWGHDLSGGVDAPKDKGYVSVNGVGENTKKDCQFVLDGSGTSPSPDSVPPVISLNGSNPVTVIKGATYTDAGATAIDERDGNITVTTTGNVNTNTVGTYTLTYRAVDKAGNVATKSRTVNVQLGADTTKPVITLNGAASITINQGATYVDAGAEAVDDRDGNLTVTKTGQVDTSKVQTYILSYSATDSSGNTATIKRTVIVKAVSSTDTTKPTITLNGATSITIDKGVTYTDAGATAIDDTDGNILVSTTNNVDTNKEGTYTVTYTATDSAGNMATKTRTVIVKASTVSTDITKPVITLIGPSQLTINKGVFYNDPGANATDDRDGEVAIVKTGNIDSNKIGTYVLTYTATDNAGNVAIKTRTVIIKALAQADKTPPVITLNGSAQIEINKGTTYLDAGATAIDEHDGSVQVIKTGVVDTTKVGTNIITYTATDKAGNVATEIRDVIVRDNIPQDTTKPVISLAGQANVTVNKGDQYVEAGATATDNKDGVVVVKINGIVDTNKVGTYTITYTATDKAGNQSSLTRIVRVKQVSAPVVDTTPPVITLNGIAQINLTKGDTYSEAGATAMDNKDGVLPVTTTGGVDTSKIGTYTITYTAVDKANNAATKTRTIIVQAVTQPRPVQPDTISPTIVLNGAEQITIKQGNNYNDPGVTATDDRLGQIKITTTGEVDTSKAGSYTLTFTAVDAAGNKASVVRTVIVEDGEKPVIKLNGDNRLRLVVGQRYNELGATATDNVDGTVNVVVSGQVDTSKIGTYTLTYQATDQANNTAELTRTVIVDAVKNKSGGGSMGWMLILMMLAVSYLRKTVNRQ